MRTLPLLITAGLILLSSPALAKAREVVKSGPLSAQVADNFRCEETVELTVKAKDPAVFTGDTTKVQRIVAAARSILGFECANIERLQVVGMVDGSRVYQGNSAADKNWRLAGTVAQSGTAGPAPGKSAPPTNSAARWVADEPAATEQQIAEAQEYFETCKGDAKLSARKHCGCAATAYLQTRLKLGETATAEEVIDANVASCLKGCEGATEAQVAEANSVYHACVNDGELSTFTDCDCLLAKFLPLRMEQGPEKTSTQLIRDISKTGCFNAVDSARYEYEKCIKRPHHIPPLIKGAEPEGFCACYSEKWADLFGNHDSEKDGRMFYNIKTNYRAKAGLYCRDKLGKR